MTQKGNRTDPKKAGAPGGKKVVSPLQDTVKTWLSKCTPFSNANAPEAAILFIVAQHNMGHLPVSVSVIPSPCFINLLLYGLRE